MSICVYVSMYASSYVYMAWANIMAKQIWLGRTTRGRNSGADNFEADMARANMAGANFGFVNIAIQYCFRNSIAHTFFNIAVCIAILFLT